MAPVWGFGTTATCPSEAGGSLVFSAILFVVLLVFSKEVFALLSLIVGTTFIFSKFWF